MQATYEKTVQSGWIHPDVFYHFGICWEVSEPTGPKITFLFEKRFELKNSLAVSRVILTQGVRKF